MKNSPLDNEDPRVSDDVLIPARTRLPANPAQRPLSDEQPGPARPFILRGVTARIVVPSARHRTSPGSTLIEGKCNEDGKMVEDSYTVPDS